MSVKVIDEKVIRDKETYTRVQTLVADIKKLHTVISHAEEEIEQKKTEVKTIGVDIFYKDIDEPEIPKFHSSHEFHIPEGVIRIAYKVKSRPMTEINGKPAGAIADEIFKEYSDKLFTKDTSYEVTSDEATQRKQACEHPEVFQIALKPLTFEQVTKLIIEHPEYLTVNVTNLKKYAEVYPGNVKKSTSIKVNNGFLDVVDKMENVIKENARKFIRALLKPSLEPAVICGNKSKK